jgi:hypothetical protein
MAVIGKVGSYGTIAPIQGNPLGDALKDIEDNAFKYRAEKRLEDEAKKKAEEEEDKVIDASVKAIKAETTPYATRNAMVIDFANTLREGVAKNAMDYKNGKISKTEFNIYNANANSQIDVLNASSKRLSDQNANMTKLVGEDKLAKGFEEDALALGGAVDKNQIQWNLLPDGSMEAIVYEKDPKTGEVKVLDKGGLEKIGEVAYTPVMKVDFDTELEQFKKGHPMDVIETLNPLTKKKVTELTPRLKESISDYVDAKLVDKNALAVAYYEATGKRDRNVTDEKEIEKAKEYLRNKYETSYQKEIGIDEATQRASEARATRKDRKEEEATTPVIGTGTITAKEGVVEGTNTVVPKGTKTFAISNAERKLGTGKIEKLKEVRVKPDGNLVYVVQETYEGENIQTKRLSEAGKQKEEFNKKNAKAIKEGAVKEKVIYSDDYDTVTTASKRPTTKAYDTSDNADDAENFAIMLKNPDTGEYFSGLNEANTYFKQKSKGLTQGGRKETPEERAKRIASGK